VCFFSADIQEARQQNGTLLEKDQGAQGMIVSLERTPWKCLFQICKGTLQIGRAVAKEPSYHLPASNVTFLGSAKIKQL